MSNNTKISFNKPTTFSNDFFPQEKSTKAFARKLGFFCDQYASFDPKILVVNRTNIQEKPVNNLMLKTVLKVCSYILTAGLLALVALAIKTVYKIWVFKNIPYEALVKPAVIKLPKPLENRQQQNQIPKISLPKTSETVVQKNPLEIPKKVEIKKPQVAKPVELPKQKPAKKTKDEVIQQVLPIAVKHQPLEQLEPQPIVEPEKPSSPETPSVSLESELEQAIPTSDIETSELEKLKQMVKFEEIEGSDYSFGTLTLEDMSKYVASNKAEYTPSSEQLPPETPIIQSELVPEQITQRPSEEGFSKHVLDHLKIILNSETPDHEKLKHLFELEKIKRHDYTLDTLTKEDMKKHVFPVPEKKNIDEVIKEKRPDQFLLKTKGARPGIPVKFMSLSHFVGKEIETIIGKNRGNLDFHKAINQLKLGPTVIERINKAPLNLPNNNKKNFQTGSGRQMTLVQLETHEEKSTEEFVGPDAIGFDEKFGTTNLVEEETERPKNEDAFKVLEDLAATKNNT